jgi:hydroxymethylpyrimidine/phosphomethylpyrimidine kinase
LFETPVALTVAGSDSGGGAGLQADLKTLEHFGVFGCSVVTLITAQNTIGVSALVFLEPDIVTAQLRAVSDDFSLAAVKFGALGNASIMGAVADWWRSLEKKPPLVIDPVMVSKHGHLLLDAASTDYLRQHILPLADVITPNRHEAALLWGRPIESLADARSAAEGLADELDCAVIITAGSFEGDVATDVVAGAGSLAELSAPRLETRHLHGTGCTFSAAILAGLAGGLDLKSSALQAKCYTSAAIANGPAIGGGVRPLWHRLTSTNA